VHAASITALMMVAANDSETSASFYQTIRRNNPEDSNLNFLNCSPYYWISTQEGITLLVEFIFLSTARPH
jgi:hypothetical protein